MKPVSWKKVESGLEQLEAPKPPTPAAEFWADFKARARMAPQQSAEPAVHPALAMRWALAAACVLVLAGVTVGGFFMRPGPVGGTAIESLEVVASHTAVLIMNDESKPGTILWVVDMDDDGKGESL